MRKIMSWLMREIPYTEVWMRQIYAGIRKIRPKSIAAASKNGKTKAEKKIELGQIKEVLHGLGIQEGDFLVVHSSMDGLRNANISAVEWIKLLQELVGNTGTVSFAAFQAYGERDRIIEDGKEITLYNPDKIKIATGLLPNVFCRMPDVVRSKCPSNSLAAWGKEAQEMMKDNLKDDLAHGKHSAWNYAVQHHAKILYLGIPVTDADTIVHVAEDCMDKQWPIENWYKESEFYIMDGKEKIKKTMRLRNGCWHRYFTAQYSGKLLDKNNLRKKAAIEGITIELIPDSKKYIDFLIKEAKEGRMLYRIRKKYWRK